MFLPLDFLTVLDLVLLMHLALVLHHGLQLRFPFLWILIWLITKMTQPHQLDI